MDIPRAPLVTKPETEITATVLRETSKLAAFIRRRVRDVGDAEDILQDVMLELVRAYRLPEPIEQVGRWLFRVARNRIIDRHRKHRAQPLTEAGTLANEADATERLDLPLPALDGGPEAALSRSMLLEALQEALDELPGPQREVFIAHEIDGLSFKEIAQRCGESINTLLGRKRSAVLHLRGRLQALYDDLDL